MRYSDKRSDNKWIESRAHIDCHIEEADENEDHNSRPVQTLFPEMEDEGRRIVLAIRYGN